MLDLDLDLDPRHRELLRLAGVDAPETLARAEARPLAIRLRLLNEEPSLLPHSPSPVLIGVWIHGGAENVDGGRGSGKHQGGSGDRGVSHSGEPPSGEESSGINTLRTTMVWIQRARRLLASIGGPSPEDSADPAPATSSKGSGPPRPSPA